MVKYAPRKVYIRESGGYVELSYTEFCRCRESDQTYMDKLFIPIQGCLLEVVREQYTDFYRDKERWRYLQKLDTKDNPLKEMLETAGEIVSQDSDTEQAYLAFICKRLKLNFRKLSVEERKWLKKIAEKSDLLKNPKPQRGRR